MRLAKATDEELKSYYKEVCRAWAVANLKEDLDKMNQIELESYRRNISLW